MNTQERAEALVQEAERLQKVAALEQDMVKAKKRASKGKGQPADDSDYRRAKDKLRQARREARQDPTFHAQPGDAVAAPGTTNARNGG